MKGFIAFLFFFCAFIVQSQNTNQVKETVPEFKLWLLDGSKITQNEIKNKVVVLKFWFTSCMPCLVDIPTMNSLVKEFEDRDDLLFIAPALDRKKKIEELLKVRSFDFKIAYNAIDVSRKFNKSQYYPAYFIIDKKGKFVEIDSRGGIYNPLKKALLKALEM